MTENCQKGNVQHRCCFSLHLFALPELKRLVLEDRLSRIKRQVCLFFLLKGNTAFVICDSLFFFLDRQVDSGLSLSPRLSNWNLSLQSESVQGLAGYCTQGPGFSTQTILSSMQTCSGFIEQFYISVFCSDEKGNIQLKYSLNLNIL